MKYFLPALLLINLCVGQTSSDAAVRIVAYPDVYGIDLEWSPDYDASSTVIRRKPIDETTWTVIATPDPTDSNFSDDDVEEGEVYEYSLVIDSDITAYGYVASICWHREPVHSWGSLMLIIEDRFAVPLSDEILRLERDLVGDGWRVESRYVSRDDSPEDIRDEIALMWATEPDMEAVILLGHVPVPYSGRLNPDGHSDHRGAWPADVYYADPSGGYSDTYIDETSASREANWNIPGDGKWDQSVISGRADLMVGRIDFEGMSAFELSDTALLRQYLDRDHAYRMGEFVPRKRALIDDNFGYFSGEAFAASGYRVAYALVTRDSTFTGDFISDLSDTTGYLFAYGCGGGSYTSASGIGNTANMAEATLNAPFTALFGSYFGDWDVTNSFLRSPLAAEGWVLTCSWSGRPNHYYHQMAVGYPVGYGFRASQNNSSTYIAGYGARYIHSALMGDPTIRAHYFRPPSNLIAERGDFGFDVRLTWTPSPDTAVTEYHVYGGTDFGDYIHIGESEDTIFDWNSGIAGMQHFMVRAEKIEYSPTGLYSNLSLGIFDSVMVTGIEESSTPQDIALKAYPNPFNSVLNIESSHAVEIYDLGGRKIADISPGGGSVDFTGRATGIYLLRMQTDKGYREKKVLLVK